MGPIASFLLACAASAALAQDISNSLHHHHHVHDIPGYCHSPILRSFPLLSSPICSNDTLTTKYQASPSHTAWTRATSCSANTNGTDEYCVFISSTFGSGRGIAVITSPERADFMASLPAFTNEHVLRHENAEPDTDLAPFKFVHVPGKDMGVVATRPIYRGAHLMSFTPAVVIDYGAFENLPEAEVRRLQTEAVDYLPSVVRGRFMDLSTHDGASDHVERVEKILKTNAFDVDLGDSGEHGLYVVFPESKHRVYSSLFGPRRQLTTRQYRDSTMTAVPTQTTGSTRRRWCSTCLPQNPSIQVKRLVSRIWSKSYTPPQEDHGFQSRTRVKTLRLTPVFTQSHTTTRQATAKAAQRLGLQVHLLTLHPTTGAHSSIRRAHQADQADPQATRRLLDRVGGDTADGGPVCQSVRAGAAGRVDLRGVCVCCY